MKIENKSGHALSHIIIGKDNKKITYFVKNEGILEVPDDVAKLWLKIKGVKEYADPAELKKLQEENARLKAEAEAKKAKKSKKDITENAE